MDINTFKRLAENYKTIPVYKRILADLLTPISAYMKLIKNSLCLYLRIRGKRRAVWEIFFYWAKSSDDIKI